MSVADRRREGESLDEWVTRSDRERENGILARIGRDVYNVDDRDAKDTAEVVRLVGVAVAFLRCVQTRN